MTKSGVISFIHRPGHLVIPSLVQIRVPHLWEIVLIKQGRSFLISLPATSVCCLFPLRKIYELAVGAPDLFSLSFREKCFFNFPSYTLIGFFIPIILSYFCFQELEIF